MCCGLTTYGWCTDLKSKLNYTIPHVRCTWRDFLCDTGKRVFCDAGKRRLLVHDNFPRREVADFDNINAGSESAVTYPAAFHVEYAHCAVVTAFHDDIAVQTLDGDILYVKFVNAGVVTAVVTTDIAVHLKMRGAPVDGIPIGKRRSAGNGNQRGRVAADR